MKRSWRGTLVLALILAAGCGNGRPAPSTLDDLVAELRRDPQDDLRGLIILIDGSVVREEYFNGSSRDELHDIRSAGKSVTSLLAGIAIDRGLIAGVDQPVSSLLRSAASPPHLATITLADLLTMRSGLAADDSDPLSPGNESRLDAAADWLAFALAVPAREAPARSYVYNSLTAFLVGAVVEQATGAALEDFAAAHLFGPLGITAHRWRRGPRGEGAGQGNLSLRLRDLASLGELVRGLGTYRGRRVVSEAWVTASLSPHVAIGAVDRYADHYGYMWYRKRYDIDGTGVVVHFASGNGGNKIYVVPARRMVIAITSAAYGERHGQPRSERILRAVLATTTDVERSP
jgi:CubicO group peptidase (beta-lactamase class C family)